MNAESAGSRPRTQGTTTIDRVEARITGGDEVDGTEYITDRPWPLAGAG